MSSIPDPATTEWVPLQGRASGMSYRGQYVGGQTYNDGDCAIGPDGVLYCCIKDGTTTTPDVWPGAAGPAGPAGVGSDLRYDGAYVAGSYTDGDIVIGSDGISYICVRPTSAAPVPWATGVAPGRPTYGTTLPASPVDGQEAILVDSLTNPTYQWRFRYNVGSTSLYKWECIGGSPVIIRNDNSETTTSTSVVDLATVGPQITLPRDGEYNIQYQAQFTNTLATSNYLQLNINGTPDGSGIGIIALAVPVASMYMSMGQMGRLAVTGTRVVKLQYYVASGTGTYLRRILQVTPVRVS